jgi:hypothetical protein
MKIDANEIWNEIQENHKKIESCNKHDFSIDLNPDKKFDKKYQCSKCGGHVDAIKKSWYEKGLKHGAVI